MAEVGSFPAVSPPIFEARISNRSLRVLSFLQHLKFPLGNLDLGGVRVGVEEGGPLPRDAALEARAAEGNRVRREVEAPVAQDLRGRRAVVPSGLPAGCGRL